MASTKKRKNKKEEKVLNETLQLRITMLVVIFIVLIASLQLGLVGRYVHYFFAYFFGNFIGILYGLILLFAVYLFVKLKIPSTTSPEAVGTYLVLLALIILASIPSDHTIKGMQVVDLFFSQPEILRGGLIGSLLYGCFSMLFDYVGTLIACVLILLVGLALILGRTYIKHQQKVLKFKQKQIDHYHQLVEASKQKNEMKKKKKPAFFPEKAFDDEKEEPVKVISVENEDNTFVLQEEQDDQEIQEESSILKEEEIVIENYNASLPQDKEAMVETKEEKQDEDSTDDFLVEQSKNEEVHLEKEVPVVKEYHFPPLSLLNPIHYSSNHKQASQFAASNANKLIQVLKQFGVNAKVKNVYIGPSVTKYEITIETGTRVNKIIQLQDDIKMALAAKDLRIEAPIPGKSAVGIEIPNLEANTVTFREVFKDIPQKYDESKLLVPLGKDVTGNSIYAELNKMPHLLIAGATGSGKSVCVNSMICSILMRAKPDEVKLLLVDPKKVELTNYNGIPHLLAPVVTDPKKAAVALRMIVEEMERRYDLFAKYNVRNMAGYNRYIENNPSEENEILEKLPFIVVILDEVADLMMVASKDVEDCIMRISQMARAAGIHLIVATQRPSTDVITGVIKANIPSRIAFAVSSSIDSRTILDTSGAEKLLGKGDMLFSPMGSSHPVRVQGAFVSDEEVEKIVEFVKGQQEAHYDEKYTNIKATSSNFNSSYDDDDEEYEMAREFVIQSQKASASLLQRQFRIGYNKAARLIDQLEQNGVIGPQIGSKPREVLIRGYKEE